MNTELSDQEIIEQVLSGKKEKYAELMKKYNQRLYRIGRGYLKDEDEIEDAMQEAYVKGYQNLEKFEGKSQFYTWITRILINECLQRIKKMERMRTMNNEEENLISKNSDYKNPETESMNKELKHLLEKSIDQLPEKYRSVFVMREVEKLSVEETCDVTGLSESNVKVRLNRAKEMLRNVLTQTYPIGNLFDFNLVRCDRIVEKVMARI